MSTVPQVVAATAARRRLVLVDADDVRRVAADLSGGAGRADDIAPVTRALVTAWAGIDAGLSPVIGHGGVAALFDRSVYIAAGAHSWLDPIRRAFAERLDADALASAFEGQSVAEASNAGATLLLTFHQLLASLVGQSLAERLLQPTWNRLAQGRAARPIDPMSGKP